MKQAVLVFAIALVITLAIGPAVINYLRKMKFGQKILEIGPKWHMNNRIFGQWAALCSLSVSRRQSLSAIS